MSLNKIWFSFVFSILLSCLLQAKTLPNTEIGQAPPFLISMGDTSLALLLQTQQPIKKVIASDLEIVDDTLLPPCDVVFYKGGKIEYCKIIETTPTTITYKMCDYQDGPNIVVNKSDVHKIRYANGREEVVIPSTQQSQTNAYVKARKDPMSTWALICSLVGLILVPALIAGIVLGIISLVRINKSEGRLRGKGTALAAVIVGGVLLLLTIILI